MNEKTEYIIPKLADLIKAAKAAHFTPPAKRIRIEIALDTILYLQAQNDVKDKRIQMLEARERAEVAA